MRKSKVTTAAAAVAKIKDGAVVAIEGSGGGALEPAYLMRAIRDRFLAEGHPRDLTLFHTSGMGDKAGGGTDVLAYEGLVKRVIAGHWGLSPVMAKLALEDKIEAYNIPQGVVSQLYGEIAAKRPGIITKIGLNTFVDPRLEGGKMSPSAKDDIVHVIELNGEEWLFYPVTKLDVVLVRGTTIDVDGNMTTDEEAMVLEGCSIAQAGRNCGAHIIAQGKYLAERGTLPGQRVRIPGILVDDVVIDPDQRQTAETVYSPSIAGATRVPLLSLPPLPLDERKVIARRGVKELVPGAVMNLGLGMPAGVASVATEQGLIDEVTFCLEQGLVGGMPASGIIFGVSYNPDAIVDTMNQFNFFDGGGLDITFLGAAQVDSHGNVNSSKTGTLLSGCGGFINISQFAKKVVFCTTFTAKGLKVGIGGGKLEIRQEGGIKKFVENVDQITFSSKNSELVNQEVLIITERAVFSVEKRVVTLREVAPGINLEKEVLGLMGFKPEIAKDLKLMDAAIFE